MKLLLHVCCAPCSIYPIECLLQDGVSIATYFYNPNIHPYKEFKRRLDTVKDYATERNITLLIDNEYGIKKFLRAVVFKEEDRCEYCYKERLSETALKAKNEGFDSFSTTLLYSKYQNHEYWASFTN